MVIRVFLNPFTVVAPKQVYFGDTGLNFEMTGRQVKFGLCLPYMAVMFCRNLKEFFTLSKSYICTNITVVGKQ